MGQNETTHEAAASRASLLPSWLADGLMPSCLASFRPPHIAVWLWVAVGHVLHFGLPTSQYSGLQEHCFPVLGTSCD